MITHLQYVDGIYVYVFSSHLMKIFVNDSETTMSLLFAF